MKAILIAKFVNSYDEICISDVPDTKPKDSEVVVGIKAAGINFVDLLYARGKHQNNLRHMKPPFLLGLEFSGTILSAPPSSPFPVGTHVFGGGQGSFSQKISISPSHLRRIPPSFSFADAAGLSATAPVSYGGLITRGRLRKGETVLVHAAAGGLGLMAVQIAKAVGARVIGTAGSEEKRRVVRRFGADEVLGYGMKGWEEEVLRMTGGQGVDVVYDSVGMVEGSLRCLKHGGRVLIIGFAGTEGKIEKIAMNRVLLKQAQIIGYRFGETDRRNPAETAEIWKGVMEMVDAGLIKPTVYNTEYRGLEQVPAAMHDLANRKVWGKAVITLPDEEIVKSKI